LPALLAALALVAQDSRPDARSATPRPQSQPATRPDLPRGEVRIDPEAVRETLEFLAGDALLGRDTPSAGLEAAAEYVARRFAQAGLEPIGAHGTYFHRYTLPGHELDPKGVRVVVEEGGKRTTLAPGTDVRWWRGTRGAEGVTDPIRIGAEDLVGDRLRNRLRGGKPILVEVGADSPLWLAAAGKRNTIGGRGAPWLLVREGLLGKDAAITVTVPAAPSADVELRNVVGLLPGRRPAEEYVLFSAHYDHIGVDLPRNGDAVRNGADDDATGTTAVVLLAEAFAARKASLPRGLVFVCFSAEERGLLGSKAFAEKPPLPLERVVANVNLEMLGRPPPGRRLQAWITGADLSDFKAIVEPGLRRAGIELVKFDMAAQLFFASDNYSLARAGVVAHSISAGSLHEDYHQPGDQVEKIDAEHMADVIEGLYEAGLDLARHPGRPKYTERGRSVLGQGR
jgi:hypothetical protein